MQCGIGQLPQFSILTSAYLVAKRLFHLLKFFEYLFSYGFIKFVKMPVPAFFVFYFPGAKFQTAHLYFERASSSLRYFHLFSSFPLLLEALMRQAPFPGL